jgi:4-hydroxy-2-oxoheptanedioate aldolase
MNLQDDIGALARYRELGLRWINVHLKVFMERGAKTFLRALSRPGRNTLH